MKYQVHLNIFTIGATLASSNSSEFLSLITVNINIYVLYKMGIILYKNDLQIDKTQLPLKNQEETLLTEILCKGHLWATIPQLPLEDLWIKVSNL